MPADGERQLPVVGRCVVHLELLAEPVVGHERAQGEATVGRLAHEHVAHEREEVGGGPAVVAVAHATAVEAGVHRLGPRPRGGRDREQPVESFERPTVADLELHERKLQRQVRGEAGVADPLEEGGTQAEALPDHLCGGDDAGIVGGHEPEGPTGGEGADRPRVDAAPRTGGDGRGAEAGRDRCEGGVDVGPEAPCPRPRVSGGIRLAQRVQDLGSIEHAPETPQVVPVVDVERAEVPGGGARRQQAVVLNAPETGPGARPLALDPLGARCDDRGEAGDRGGVTVEAPVLTDGVEGGAVRVPLPGLAEEQAVAALAPWVRGEDLGHLVGVAVAVEGPEQVGRVAEPEAVVGGGARRDLVAVVQEQQEATVGLDCGGEPRVREHEPHAPSGVGLPPVRHLGGGRHRGGGGGRSREAAPGEATAAGALR